MSTSERAGELGADVGVFDDPRWEALATGTATPDVVEELRAWAARSNEAKDAWIAFQPVEPGWLDDIADEFARKIEAGKRAPVRLVAGASFARRYRLKRQISAGNHTFSWEAEDIISGDRVVIKLVSPSALDAYDGEAGLRLQREGRVLQKIRHPGIVQILDVGSLNDGTQFLVTEYLQGEDLSQLLKSKRRLPLRVAIAIARELADALAVAHDARIIHRNLQPQNVFLHHDDAMNSGDFAVKLIGFGLCKDLGEADALITQEQSTLGSALYVSPEQTRTRDTIDARTDIWSLGVVLFNMITGTAPFLEHSPIEIFHAIATTAVPLPSTRIRGVPVAVDEIVSLCTQRDRDKRIQSAAKVGAMLAAAEAEISTLVEGFGVAHDMRVAMPRDTPYRLPASPETSRVTINEADTLPSTNVDDVPKRPLRRIRPRTIARALCVIFAAACVGGAFYAWCKHAATTIEAMNVSSLAKDEKIRSLEGQAAKLEAERKALLERLDALQRDLEQRNAEPSQHEEPHTFPATEETPPPRAPVQKSTASPVPRPPASGAKPERPQPG